MMERDGEGRTISRRAERSTYDRMLGSLGRKADVVQVEEACLLTAVSCGHFYQRLPAGRDRSASLTGIYESAPIQSQFHDICSTRVYVQASSIRIAQYDSTLGSLGDSSTPLHPAIPSLQMLQPDKI